MRPKYLDPVHGRNDRWIVSYMDMLTILLILFVAVAAKTFESAQNRPAPPAPPPVSVPLARPPEALAETQQKLKQQGIDALLESRGVVISLPQRVVYAPGDDRISPSALPVIGQIASVLDELPNQVSLAGYADSVPIHNRRFRNNWELAASRGLRLLDLLTHRFGIAESRLSVASYGTRDPRNSNDTSGGRAANRRVEIIILK